MCPHLCNPKTYYYLAWSLLAEWDFKKNTIQMVTKIQSKKMKFRLGHLFERVLKRRVPDHQSKRSLTFLPKLESRDLCFQIESYPTWILRQTVDETIHFVWTLQPGWCFFVPSEPPLKNARFLRKPVWHCDTAFSSRNPQPTNYTTRWARSPVILEL